MTPKEIEARIVAKLKALLDRNADGKIDHADVVAAVQQTTAVAEAQTVAKPKAAIIVSMIAGAAIATIFWALVFHVTH